jgi:hypothetical protein
MNTGCSAIDDICRDKLRQSPKPQTGCFGFAVTKLPWMNGLRLFYADNLLGVPMHDRVFNRDSRRWSVKHFKKKRCAIFH